MSNRDIFPSDSWEVYLERAKKTNQVFRSYNEMCEASFKSSWLIWNTLDVAVRKKGNVLPPSQQFVAIYSRRNLVYLSSSHVLANIGFIHPSSSLMRTVYETILRSYLFMVNPEEANLYHSNFKTDKEEAFLRSRGFYQHRFLIKQLFRSETQKQHRRLYQELCVSSHAEFKGLFLDFPSYTEKSIEDRLKMILSLNYGNIQMIAEGFFDILDSSLRNVIRTILNEIVRSLGKRVPLFEPDREKYSSAIRLKRGNFMEVLE